MITPAPSDLHHFPWQRALEWSALIGFILFLIYAARKILEEKTNFAQDSVERRWGKLTIKVARWWSETSPSSNDYWLFCRTDTHYDWEAKFWMPQISSCCAQTTCEAWLRQNGFILDTAETQISQRASDLFCLTKTYQACRDFYRVEGTATQHEQDRKYVDCVVFYLDEDPNVYMAVSLSSVLNGGVEGPFFEETLKLADLD